MKGVLVIIDGMGDLPHRQLKGQTPLEVAETPNLDFLATRGEMGYMYPVKPGFIPGSDEALVAMFGNEIIASSRGQLEARGAEMKLTRGDLALRANFATIESLKSGNLIDRRAGRTLTTEEAQILSKAINKIKIPVGFEFKPSVQHRGALVFKGGFSDNFIGNDPHPVTGKFRICKPSDDEENTHYTVNILNEFLEKVHAVLDKHPVNDARKEKGLLPANYLLVRNPGIEIPKLKQYKKWMSVVGMPLEIGFSKLSGMKVMKFEPQRLKTFDAYANLYDILKKRCKFAIKTIKKYHKKFDYVYFHIKETDLPGHDNKPFEKKNMLEYIDQTFIKFLRNFAPKRKISVVVTADHSTPCKLKDHSADPVPVLFYNHSIPKEKHFSEKEARRGILGGFMGNELLEKVNFSK